ncbi:TonB-dependent siderophore receptor [Paracandidimonas soli]|uniref:Ferric aerobactin receptor n=1 Tax=Paracandidimonas soli TaxID=1917182 RepID=A0A4R3UQ28_9BURK|nr:TonB-dependent receptor [Paracandidimonas soli]TCU93915.1 iron complex outermembrane receptor protein [Paracandidimonas soli]
MNLTHRHIRGYRLLPAIALGIGLATSVHGQAARMEFNQPAIALDSAINQVARQSGVQVLFDSDHASRLMAPALQGSYTADEALQRLLARSGLVLEARGAGTYVIVRDTAVGQPVQSAGAISGVDTLPMVTVVASRAPRSIDETPNTVWVIEREQIEAQARAGVPLKEMLGQLVPGLDMGGQMRTNFGQNLRGRPAQVMIDGISLNGSRLLSRQFDSIDPFNIERIEVLSGATAIYGGNATGGIINIITKRADASAPTFTSEAGIRTGGRGSDDFSWHGAQSIQGGNDVAQGRLAIAYSRNGGSYDGNGDRVLPDITQTDLQWNQSIDVLGTADIDLQEWGTLKLLAQYYDSGYKPGKALWMQPGPGNNILNPSDLDVRDGFSSDVEPNTRRHLLAADYHKPGVLGGQELYLKAYHRDESLKFYPFPGADANPLGGARVPYWSTSTQETTTYGFKAMLLKDWSRLRLSYGVDYDHEKFKANQTMFDVNRAIGSGGLQFREMSSLGRYPGFETDIWSAYAQADAKLTDQLTFSAGIRHQKVDIEVADFAQVAQQRLVAAGYGVAAQAIPGGKNDYSTTLINAGLVYRLTPAQQVWINYSEGFELADPAKYYGTGATYKPLAGANSVWELDRYLSVSGTSMAAIKTKSMEVGWRFNQGGWHAQAALFHSQSDKSIAVDRSTLTIQLNESKVRNYGLEGQVDYRWDSGWFVGSSFLLLRTEQQDDGTWNRRGVYYASPSKATLYAGRQTDRWGVRLQAAHSLRLNSDVPSFGTGPGESLPSLTLFDLMANYRMKHGNGARGTISLGVQNLFDKTYATRWSEQAKLAYASSIAPSVLDFKGQGRTFALTYTLEY